jgi:hypothetical protein
MKIILGEDTFEEATRPSDWEVLTSGSISLSPAQITDPDNILIRTPGAPRLEEIGATFWSKNPGDFSDAKNPWKASKSGVAELETVLQHKTTGDKWKILVRGQQRRYIVVQAYPIPHLP